MPPNCSPCPCMPLQKGAKNVAEVDGVLKCLAIISLIFILVELGHPESLSSDHPVYQVYVENGIEGIRLVFIISLVFTTIELLTSILLFCGAVKKNTTLCWVWIVATIISVSGNCIALIRKTPMGATLIIYIIWTSFRIYGVIVVIAFIREVRQQQQQVQNGNLPSVQNQSQIEYQPENQDNSSTKPQPSVYAVVS